jgi:hypothetical protein
MAPEVGPTTRRVPVSEAGDRSSPDRRLRFFRFGLLAITGVVFAVVTAGTYVISGADLTGSLMKGLLWGVIVGVVSIILYMVYKSAALKA